MKERMGIKESISMFRSLISPFGAVEIKPLKGVSVEVENIPDRNAPENGIASIDERGRVIIPRGSTAKAIFRQGDGETELRIDDYRSRPGHTPGAKITGNDIDIELTPKKNSKFIPGIGYTSYRK